MVGSDGGDFSLCKAADSTTLTYINRPASMNVTWDVGGSWSFDWNPVCIISAADSITIRYSSGTKTETQDLTGITTLAADEVMLIGRELISGKQTGHLHYILTSTFINHII